MTRSRLATAGFLVTWAVVCTVVGAGLMRSHWVPLPVPPAGDTLPDCSGGWTAIHVLASDCGCSRRVLSRLRGRPPIPGVRERVLWVGGGDVAEPMPAGFEVESLTTEGLREKYRIEAVPVLVVVDPDGVVRYRGGYTARKQGFDIRDAAIISAVRRGDAVSPLPVYGCPSSDRLRAETAFVPEWLGGGTP